ncbi:MAG TPA: alpha/beta hydrolase [Tepidisphaeraceae bacterium]|nr:alpha/beta hydrolase [Tepidisphaeraceae bacterium]
MMRTAVANKSGTAQTPRAQRQTWRIPWFFVYALRSGRLCGSICLVFFAILSGCATQTISPRQPNTVIVVPGIGGDGQVYAQIVHSLHDHGSTDCLRVWDWGSSYPVFVISISSRIWHYISENHLANQIIQWRTDHPHSRIVLIAHSAGAGVVMGALARLPHSIQVGPIILLAPSLSPDFDLRPALKHASVIHVFYSPEDDFWQGFGPIVFGTYDHAHRSGAGRKGFTLLGLSPADKARVIQHPYEKDWSALGVRGGHFDWMAEPFVAAVLKPLIDAPPTKTNSIAAGTGRSCAASPR